MLKIYITSLLLAFCLTIMAEDVESLNMFELYKMNIANRHFVHQRFPKAIATYEKLYEENKLSAEHKNEYAIMLLTKGETKEAINALQNASDEIGVKLLFNAYLYDSAYSKADSVFQLYPEVTDASITGETSLQTYLKECNNNAAYKIDISDFNSAEMGFSPSVYDDIIYFTSDRGDISFVRGDYKLTGGAYLDVYTVKEDSVSKATGGINMPYNDGPLAFSKDGNTVLITRNYYEVTNYGNQKEDYNPLQIYRAVKEADGKWGEFKMLPFCNKEYSCNDPFIYGDELYFTSDMPGGFGRTDIYKVKISENLDAIGTPENLGSDINTEEQEGFPFVDEEGVLYYASSGFIGFGGLDIYTATQSGASYQVENMGHKINTNYDDFSLFMENDTAGYFASNRPGGEGSDDIYHFYIRPQLDYKVQVIDANTKKRLNDIAYTISELPEEQTYDVVSDSTELYNLAVFEEIEKAQFDVPESDRYLAFSESLSPNDSLLFTVALTPSNIGVYGYVYNELTGERYPTASMRIYHQDTVTSLARMSARSERSVSFRDGADR